MGSNLVQWQMDITGLTQFFMGAGAVGLKQLAQAGVDPHTIGSLLTLGDLSPVSNECRKKLNACRVEQKKSRRWIYKAIEIGSATNFLADELLKTRSGENVLALFSAIMPVLSENSYTDALLMLYSTSNIDSDSTPGIGQMQRLRTSLLSFTNSMDIKNKILQYHMLFRQYGQSYQEPNHGIPNAETMSKLVQAFRTIATSEDQYRLNYRGIQGAAWTAAYASHILGLGICMVAPLDEGQIPIPITAGFETAKVVFYVGSGMDGIELCKSGVVEDLIHRTSITKSAVEWMVDCDDISYFNTQHTDLRNRELQHQISIFVSAKALDCVAELSQELSYSVNMSQMKAHMPLGLLTYQRSVLPAVQRRCLSVLKVLGFSPPPYEAFEFDETGHTIGMKTNGTSPSQRPSKHQEPTYWLAAKGHPKEKWWSESLEAGFHHFFTYWAGNFKKMKKKAGGNFGYVVNRQECCNICGIYGFYRLECLVTTHTCHLLQPGHCA